MKDVQCLADAFAARLAGETRPEQLGEQVAHARCRRASSWQDRRQYVRMLVGSYLLRKRAISRFAELLDQREIPREPFLPVINCLQRVWKMHIASLFDRGLSSCIWETAAQNIPRGVSFRRTKTPRVHAVSAGHFNHVLNPTMMVRRATRLRASSSAFRFYQRHSVGVSRAIATVDRSARGLENEFFFLVTGLPSRPSQTA